MTIKRLTAARAVRFKRPIGNRSNWSSGNSYARAPTFSFNRPRVGSEGFSPNVARGGANDIASHAQRRCSLWVLYGN